MRHYEGLFVLLILALIPLAFLRWAFVPRRKLSGHRVRVTRVRIRLRLHPGRFAAFRRSRWSRRGLAFGERLIAGTAAYSTLIGHAHYRHGLRIPLEEHALIMAPPRTRKTGWLARVILHYPGPVVSTTTKHDVFELTSGVRAMRGPVHVFNPQGIGGVPSTFRWNPLDGCQDPAVAIRRADGFAQAVSMGSVEDASFWTSKASDYLRALFCAAALAGRDMRDVATWVLGDQAAEAEHILAGYGHDQWAVQLGELRSDAQKTVATVRMTMSRALSFMTDPALMTAVLPGDGDGLDIGEFLQDSGTLYLIAESRTDDSPLAPLFACLASEIHHEAALLGSMMPGGRLDPTLLFALDEITQTCPVPLPNWLADSGGKGIQVWPVAHGEAQLARRWGEHGKQIILDTCGVKLWLPGITDTRTLDMASKLCGTAAFRERGEERHTRHEVMTPEMIRQLPPGFALVIRGGMAPVVVHLPVAWRDRLYRRARRAGRAIADLAPKRALVPQPSGPVELPPAELLSEAELVPHVDEHSFPWSGEPR
jgi:type IV secretion system protein VirD4